MKQFLACLFGLVALTIAVPAPTLPSDAIRCIYESGKCIQRCPVGTHGYYADCGYKMPERTCDEPNPAEQVFCEPGSTCFCDTPTVRDTKTNKCVLFENCPKK